MQSTPALASHAYPAMRPLPLSELSGTMQQKLVQPALSALATSPDDLSGCGLSLQVSQDSFKPQLLPCEDTDLKRSGSLFPEVTSIDASLLFPHRPLRPVTIAEETVPDVSFPEVFRRTITPPALRVAAVRAEEVVTIADDAAAESALQPASSDDPAPPRVSLNQVPRFLYGTSQPQGPLEEDDVAEAEDDEELGAEEEKSPVTLDQLQQKDTETWSSSYDEEDKEGSDMSDRTPGIAEAGVVSERVRALKVIHLKEAWQKLREEFQVQIMIWDNINRVGAAGFGIPGINPEVCQKLRVLIEAALNEALDEIIVGAQSNHEHASHAVSKLEDALGQDAEAGGLINHSTKAMAAGVLKAHAVFVARRELAGILERLAAGEFQDFMPTELHLDDLLFSCELEEMGIVYRVRRVLGISMKSLHGSAGSRHRRVSNSRMAAEIETYLPDSIDIYAAPCSEPLDSISEDDPHIVADESWRARVVKLMRSKSSRDRSSSKSSHSSHSKSSEPEGGSRHSRKSLYRGTPAHVESGVLGLPGPPDVAPWVSYSSSTGSAEALSTALDVGALAAEGLDELWREIRVQYKVQHSIWDALALAHGNVPISEATMRKSFDSALALAETDRDAAIFAFEEILSKDRGGNLNYATAGAVKNVLAHEHLAKLRRELALILEAAGGAGDAWVPSQKHCGLILACKLEDLRLEYRVRLILKAPLADFKERWKSYRHSNAAALALPQPSPFSALQPKRRPLSTEPKMLQPVQLRHSASRRKKL